MVIIKFTKMNTLNIKFQTKKIHCYSQWIFLIIIDYIIEKTQFLNQL